MWRVPWGDGHVVAKQFGPGRGFGQALAVRLQVAGRHVAPPLAWLDREQRLIVSSWVGDAEPNDEADWRAVGEALSRLHTSPAGDDQVPLGRAYRMRFNALRRGAPPAIAEALERHDLERRLGVIEPWLDAQPRVLCHRDLQRPNIRMVGGTALLLDFEHAAADLWLADLVKLAAAGKPLDVVLSGYGSRGLGEVEAVALEALVAMHGAATWAWGLRHRAPDVASEGRTVLAATANGRLGT